MNIILIKSINHDAGVIATMIYIFSALFNIVLINFNPKTNFSGRRNFCKKKIHAPKARNRSGAKQLAERNTFYGEKSRAIVMEWNILFVVNFFMI